MSVWMFPCSALRRYVRFVRMAWATPWSCATSQHLLLGDDDDNSVAKLRNAQGAGCCQCRVLIVVFGSAFLQYMSCSATADMLKYVVLIKAMGANTLQIGLLDSMQSGLDVFMNFAGWGQLKQRLVTRSPHLVLGFTWILFTSGAVGICLSASLGQRYAALTGYFISNCLMTMGSGLYWIVWTPRVRRDGCKALERVWRHEDIDFSAKVAQMQVVTRYPSQALAPVLMTMLLGLGGRNEVSGLPVAYGACVVIMCLLTCASGMMLNPTSQFRPTVRGQSGEASTLSWFDLLPPWCGALAAKCGMCSLPAEARGQLSRQFVEVGLFSSMTEAIRGGYARVIALRALTMGMSPQELAIVLAVAFWTATSLFWLSDIADFGRRRAAMLSFACLGLGHALLGFSSSLHGVLASAVLFGVGEGMSTGLRALVKNDYMNDDRGILAARRDRANRSATGYFDEQQRLVFKSLCDIWDDATTVMNSIAIGVVGHFLGMGAASIAYAWLAVFAAAFSRFALPESKPPHERE